MTGTAYKAVDKAIRRFYVDNDGFRYSDLAHDLGISVNALSMKRRGLTDWKWSEILKLCEILGISPDTLAGF